MSDTNTPGDSERAPDADAHDPVEPSELYEELNDATNVDPDITTDTNDTKGTDNTKGTERTEPDADGPILGGPVGLPD